MGSHFRQVVSGCQQVRFIFAFALALLLGASVPTKAQSYLQNIGVPAFATQIPVENGFINAANGNLHLEIPLGSFPQRTGAPDKMVLMYDSAIWCGGAVCGDWKPNNITTSNGGYNSWGGWRIVTSREPGFVSNGDNYGGWCNATGDYRTDTQTPWIWTAPDGTQHSFPASITVVLYPTQCPATGNGNSTAYASDGSGFYISITNYVTHVYAPDGTIIGGLGVCNNCFATEDSNGNYAHVNFTSVLNNGVYTYTWTYIDTGTNSTYRTDHLRL